MSELEKINKIIDKYSGKLIAIPEVTGIYVGESSNGKLCIFIMVVRITENLKRALPQEIQGIPVEIEESGEIKPMG